MPLLAFPLLLLLLFQQAFSILLCFILFPHIFVVLVDIAEYVEVVLLPTDCHAGYCHIHWWYKHKDEQPQHRLQSEIEVNTKQHQQAISDQHKDMVLRQELGAEVVRYSVLDLIYLSEQNT